MHPPGLMSSRWRCDHDGDTEPMQLRAPVAGGALDQVSEASGVPVWVPWPAPVGWTLGGLGSVGDQRRPLRGSVTAWCGPSPVGGAADLVLVAEEPGIGLGARYAGVPGLDAGGCVDGVPHAKVEVAGHPVALWSCRPTRKDRAAFVGEAEGCWLWLVLWPARAQVLLLEDLVLRDARSEALTPQPGAACPHLAG